MNPNQIKKGNIYRFKTGNYKGSPCRVTNITKDEADGRHDVNYTITTGPGKGITGILPILTFANHVEIG